MSAQPTLFTKTDRRQWAKEILEQLRAQYHELSLEDRLTVRRTLREMAREDEHAADCLEALERLVEIADTYSVTPETAPNYKALHEEFCGRIELAQTAIRKAKGAL